jgi:hypothetical protein
LAQFTDLYKHYRAICASLGVALIPAVLPGYNDRGVRPEESHAIVERNLESKSFFEQSLENLGLPFSDRKKPLIIITSWNEWNEGTQIEPGNFRNQSEQIKTDTNSYNSYDTYYLKILKKFKNIFIKN